MKVVKYLKEYISWRFFKDSCKIFQELRKNSLSVPKDFPQNFSRIYNNIFILWLILDFSRILYKYFKKIHHRYFKNSSKILLESWTKQFMYALQYPLCRRRASELCCQGRRKVRKSKIWLSNLLSNLISA